jgi:5-methylcytosine-specific restriction endonuclease McrA
LEKKCLDELRKYAKLERPPSKTLIKCLGEYDALVSPTRKKGMARIDKILSGMDRVVIPRKETWYIDWIKPQSHEKYARTREKALAWDDISSAELNKMERECYKALKKFLKLKGENIETRRAVANLIFDYEYAVLGYRSISKARIRETLMARPWNHADCAVCKDVGVETIIFRGNNRNRRRGFHNSFVFYQKFKDRVKNYKKYIDLSRSGQQDLFR